jgi:cold shock CspA family protein
MGVDGNDERAPSPGRRDLSYGDIEPGDPIGRGGNADVTAARLPDGQQVALKEPRFQGTLRTETVEAFLGEAETWGTIDDHAHVVGLVDWGGAPMPWIAMEYMDGGSLADRLADGPLSVADAVRVGGETCRAVRHAHRHGLVHLDLKPANVLFREVPDGPDVAKVGDWGLARFLAEHSGSIDGLSPQYAAPEQFDAGTYGDPDDFTDIYQVGAVVYEALTGRPPFEGSGVAVMHSILDEEPDPPTTVDPALPAAVDDILLRALATEKADRHETVVDLRRALEGLDSGTSGAASSTGASTGVDGTATGDDGSDDTDLLAGGERIEGEVYVYNESDGAGFVRSDALEEDVFFYLEDIGPDSLSEGDRLRFRVRESGGETELRDVERLDPKGTRATDRDDDRGTDTTAPGAGVPDGRVRGTVDFFNDTGGYGFIVSDAVDEDAFFHMEDVGGPDLEEGQEVEFRVEPHEKGPRAVDIERMGGDLGGDTTTAGTGASDDRVRGTVDFFNDTGGYGFIVSDVVDEDVFFHMEDVGGPDLEEGQEVEFRVDHRDKGPVATDLTRL